ncbi:MAG TPA: hypothetical protein VEU95_11145 [Micropepsaceae bacterium]|nr:hypothetical protein [Micropepsaceae bacterium]
MNHASKRANAEAMLALVRRALDEARAAGEAAAEEYLKVAPRAADGILAPVNCGSALVCVSSLKPRLRGALRELGAIECGHRGTWVVEGMSGFSKGLAAQSALANSMTCRAAADTLNRLLGDQGQFWTDFRDD